uniref:Uncharacterized protein n=1 Tax=Arundo donax TaxID=35708 RepID=A0A0A8Z1D7_ARUDO
MFAQIFLSPSGLELEEPLFLSPINSCKANR